MPRHRTKLPSRDVTISVRLTKAQARALDRAAGKLDLSKYARVALWAQAKRDGVEVPGLPW